MKSKIRFVPASHKDINHSSFHGYLHISYPELVDKLGMPNDRTKEGEWRSGDEKTRVEWAFKSTHEKRPMVMTIYDYKEKPEIVRTELLKRLIPVQPGNKEAIKSQIISLLNQL